MKSYVPLAALALILVGCNAARVVSPLDKGEWRAGAALGGPQINDARLPLMSIYAARGATERRTDYVGLQLMTAGFQSLQMDAGSLLRISAPGQKGSWTPEVNAFGGGTLLVGFRDGATRIYPNAGIHTVWSPGWGFKPYLGTDLWVDPTYRLAEFDQGTLLHPNLHGGLRWIGKRIEAGVEAKWLNPTRTFMVPQQTVPSFLGTGARGLYFTLAFRIP